jgi:hypothetical protein
MNALKHTSTLSMMALVLVSGFASAQPQQLLEEPWVATKTDLLDVDADTLEFALRFDGVSSRNFKAIAFGPPAFGAVRSIVAVDGSKLVFFNEDQSAPGVWPKEIDLNTAAPGLSSVTAVAFISSDPVKLAVTGFSKRRRWFELWIGEILPDDTVGYTPGPTDHPQVTDMVYVSAEDAPGTLVPGEGVVMAAGRYVLHVPASGVGLSQIVDARSLPIRNNTSLLSVDLVGDALVIATSARELVSRSPVGTGGPYTIPGSTSCANIKPQRIVVRSADDGEALYLADVCGQIMRYTAGNLVSPDAVGTHSEALVGLDIGEGNTVVCDFGEVCQLSSDVQSTIENPSQGSAAFLVFEYELCDPRVTDGLCEGDGTVSADNVLDFNSRLPAADQDLLDVTVTIPPHIYSSQPDGSFKAILVAPLDTLESTVFSAIQGPLPDEINLPRGTPVLQLLNQDEVAYAPDTADYPTVGQYPPCDTGPCFEATPLGIGPAHSTAVRTRGFSVLAYHVMMDLKPASGLVPARAATAGLPAGTNLDLVDGSPPSCRVEVGSAIYEPINDWRYFFVNHAACLYVDLAALVKSEALIPDAAFGGNRAALEARIDNLGDKVAKASAAGGSSQAATAYQAALSQLTNFVTELQATTFVPVDGTSYQIYKNEMLVRAGKLGFQIEHRTIPSIPIGGIVIPIP